MNNGLHPQLPKRTPFDDDCVLCRQESGLRETLIHHHLPFDQHLKMRSEGVQPHFGSCIPAMEALEFVAEWISDAVFNILVFRIFGRVAQLLNKRALDK